MLAEIITIGDEILIGQITDTNSAFLASELNQVGVSVYQITSVQDDRDHILKALQEAASRVSLVIITGGLGPTKDDITKQTLCEFFEDTLVENPSVLAHVEELFRKYITTPISDLNRKQALVPSRAQVLHNAYGTAPGMWFEKDGKVFVSMPGVPFEMKAMFKEQLLGRILQYFKRPFILHRTLLTYGLGESAIAERIADIEDSLPAHVKLAYLPNLGKVRLRLSGRGEDERIVRTDVDLYAQRLKERLADIMFGEEGEPLEVEVGKVLKERGLTLAVAESCTGGKLAATLTSVPGASAYFLGGMVTYATALKVKWLKVNQRSIDKESVVSEAVAREMATGLQRETGADYTLSTTGNAGPDKGESDVAIGTVCIGLATPEGVYSWTFSMGNNRERIVQKTVNKALELLQKEFFKK